VDKESLVGGNVVLLKYQVHANLTVENELQREMILIIDKFKYLGGEGGRLDKHRLVDSRTVEEVKKRLSELAGESQSSALCAPGEMTQLVCCLDYTHKSEEEDELGGWFANIEALRRIANQTIDTNGCDDIDDVTRENGQILGKAHIISIDQQQKINDLIRQFTENTNKEVSSSTNSQDDNSLSGLDPPAHVLPSQLVDNFSTVQEPLEIVIPPEPLVEAKGDCQSTSPENEPITIDIDDHITEVEYKETDKANTLHNSTDSGTAAQSSDETIFSGCNSGQTTQCQANQICTNKSLFGFSISDLPSSTSLSSNGFPGNQEQTLSIETVTSSNERQENENLGESESQGDENSTEDEGQVDGLIVDHDDSDDERLSDMEDGLPDQPAKQSNSKHRKRDLSDDDDSDLSSVYPKRFFSLQLNQIDVKDYLYPGLASRTATDDDLKSELYQFCLQYWKEKKNPSMFGGLFHSKSQ
jgi:predicted RNA-binding protein with RPS1 domain